MDDFQKIVQAVDEGYIQGIHRFGRRDLIEKYFPDEFSMFLRDDNDDLRIMHIQEWISSIEKRKEENPESYENRNVAYEIKDIAIHEVFATVVLDLYYNDKLFAIDQFSMYKLNGEWKFIAKLYKMA